VTTEIQLYTNADGWNLVAYPSNANRSLPEVLRDNGVGTDFILVYAYDASNPPPWKMFDPNLPPFLNDLTMMTPGFAYWVKVVEIHTWSVEYLLAE
jgi:hypothetical protein